MTNCTATKFSIEPGRLLNGARPPLIFSSSWVLMKYPGQSFNSQ